MADSASAAPQNVAMTPFMAQFFAAKDKHPDALVFFRMGDFYELFFEDAEKAAAALDITLTKRGQHGGDPIPMAGVPWHQAEGYLQRLIRQGFRVAVVEQLEDPAEAKKRGAKSIVKRDVVRVVTPGTLTEDGLLDARAASLLTAIAFVGEGCALAAIDVAGGAFEVGLVDPRRLADALAALHPAEVLVGDADSARDPVKEAIAACGAALTIRPAIKADPRAGARLAQTAFEVTTLDGFGAFAPAELGAIGLALDYVMLTQAGAAPRLSPPRQMAAGGFMAMDAATRASLEILEAMRGGRDGALIGAIDRTVTAAGGRLLAEHLARPLLEVGAIRARQDGVAWFFDDSLTRGRVRADLKGGADIARALTRLALGRGGPRDLAALRDGLKAAAAAGARIASANRPCPALLGEALGALDLSGAGVAGLIQDLDQALGAELPLLLRDGGFIAPGWDQALDAARALRDDSRKVIAALQQRYAEDSGQPLKVKHNAVLGYHLEATAKQAESLMQAPLNATFIHRQTTAQAVRFTTAELAELDARIGRAADEALARELALFKVFAERAAALSAPIRRAAEAAAILDVAASHAEFAADVGACRPEVDDSQTLLLEGARHPVVERALRREGKGFTANNARLDGEGQVGPRLLLVTGPNMGGKSTYLRTVALMAVLAQAGGYVPARRMKLGIADRVFSRVGASDDLSRGRSTFMLEMVETAAILNQAGPRALVILDEIGRGTATFDGLAIAWATAEHLHDVNRCRAVFATHFHELTALAEKLAAGGNAHVRAKEWKGDLVFLHEVAAGAADRSYGVQVGKLAGLPKSVLERARAVLARLEASKTAKSLGDLGEALPLFSSAPEPAAPHALIAALAAIDPDSLTPREALEALYALKRLNTF